MSARAPSGAAGAAPTPGTPSARKLHALELFSDLPARYDALSAAFSFWQDPRWRRALVDAVAPADGQRVLDVACGTGLVSAELLRRAPVRLVALDQSPQMLAAARARFAGSGVELVEGRAEALPFPDASFDAVTFTYLLRYVDDPRATVAELARVLRPGGRIASLEFGVPPALWARALWRLYTRVGLPALGSLVSPAWRDVGAFLGPSILGFHREHPLAEIAGWWGEAGLRDVSARTMSFGAGVVMSARRADTRGPRRAPATGP
jgi:demethylmenaquinone methyltransferase/2-methoxy-6-polyprenyl-1,4-benzoquinol methylase